MCGRNIDTDVPRQNCLILQTSRPPRRREYFGAMTRAGAIVCRAGALGGEMGSEGEGWWSADMA